MDVTERFVNGHITEIIWPYYRRAQLYDSDIPLVRINFRRDDLHVIQPKLVQFSAKFNYFTAEKRGLLKVLF